MPLEIVLDYLKTIGAAKEMHHWPDAVLLERFVHRRDEAAFAMLLHRHGPMVLGVCRRVLGDVHDAEDAYQATFVVLARRADSLRRPAQLGQWLYGVAQRVALKARTKAVARRSRQRELTDMPYAEPLDELAWHELRPVLDEEISRLPEKYRAAVVLCYLQGKTHEQAAQELGWPRTSLTNRLARARDLLRSQLTGRGIVLSAGVLATALTDKTAPAAVRAMLTINTAKAAAGVAAGQAVATSVLSAQALALAEEVTRGMMGVKAKVVILALALGVTAGGAVASYHGLVAPTPDGATAVSQPVPAPAAAQPPALRVDAEGVPLPPGVLTRIGSSRMRHANVVWAVAVAPDGRTVASAGISDGVRVWETATGKPTGYFPFPDGTSFPSGGGGTNLTFAADGHDILCMTVKLERGGAFLRLDPTTGRERLRVDLERVGFSTIGASGQRFAYYDRIPLPNQPAGSVHICDAATGRELRRITDLETVHYLAFSPDDRTLAIADGSDAIAFYDAATGAKTGELKRENARYWSLAFAPDGRTLAGLHRIARPQGEVHLWDLEARQYRGKLQTNDTDRVENLRFSPDGKTLVTDEVGTEPILWDTATGQEIRRFPRIEVWGTAFTPDGKTLVAGTMRRLSGTVVLWDTATGRTLPASANPVVAVEDLRYADGGRRLIGRADRFTAWDPATGQEVERYADVPAARNITLSPDGRLLAGVDAGGALRTWDAATGQEVRQLSGEQRFVPQLTPMFTPDGRRLIAVDADRRIVVCEVATGQTLGTLTAPNNSVTKLVVSPDGHRLASFIPRIPRAGMPASGGSGDIRVWDLATYKEVQRFPITWRGTMSSDRLALVFSPDGRWLASGTDGLKLWDIETGRELRSLPTGRASRAAFSPDGRMLATDTSDDTLRLWEVATGGERHRFTGHSGIGGVRSLAFAPDGRTLAAASSEAPA